MSSELRWGIQFVLVGLGLIVGFFMGALIAFWVLGKTYENLTSISDKPAGHVQAVRPNLSSPAFFQDTFTPPGTPGNDERVAAISMDQLMAVREVRVYRSGTSLSNDYSGNALDSILGKNSHRKTSHDAFIVEFWVSPLNYRGYRLKGNHLTLYGLDPQEQMRLFRNREKLYLECLYHQYALVESAEFRPLWPLGDSRFATYNNSFDDSYIP